MEKFVDKIKEHCQLHDLSTYLEWCHDMVWAMVINTLRKLGASYLRAKEIHHPMIGYATIWEVFLIMSDQVFPFSDVARQFKTSFSECVFVNKMQKDSIKAAPFPNLHHQSGST